MMTSASTEERGERGRAPQLLRPLFLFTKLVLTWVTVYFPNRAPVIAPRITAWTANRGNARTRAETSGKTPNGHRSWNRS